ncbi:hypothetical protein AcV7_003746 [Taiwanofungus camphoratus]|nr:hypothetical protein AcV7_003746 [Antrodia cinnamomea]
MQCGGGGHGGRGGTASFPGAASPLCVLCASFFVLRSSRFSLPSSRVSLRSAPIARSRALRVPPPLTDPFRATSQRAALTETHLETLLWENTCVCQHTHQY